MPESVHKLPHAMRHLDENIHVFSINDQNVGNMSIILVNDETVEAPTFGFSAPVGYFNEQAKRYPNGLAYVVATTVLIDDFFKNKDLMSVQSQVEPETTFWTSSCHKNSLHKHVARTWDKISRFNASEIDDRLVNVVAEQFLAYLREDEFLRHYLVKKYFVKEDHPFHRISTGNTKTLVPDQIKSYANAFFQENFFANEFVFILIDRIGDSSDKPALEVRKKDLLEKLKKDLSENVALIKKYNNDPKPQDISLPFRNTPALIAIPARTKDSVTLKF